MWFFCIAYGILGFMDLVLSQIAFSLGVNEGNPVLKWFTGKELFIPSKILLTLSVCSLIIFLYNRIPKTIRVISWLAIIIMSSVNAYHLWALNQLLPP